MKKNHRKLIEDYVISANTSALAIREHLARRGVSVPRHERLEQAAQKIQKERMTQNDAK